MERGDSAGPSSTDPEALIRAWMRVEMVSLGSEREEARLQCFSDARVKVGLLVERRARGSERTSKARKQGIIAGRYVTKLALTPSPHRPPPSLPPPCSRRLLLGSLKTWSRAW
jgi:hypothetical protein